MRRNYTMVLTALLGVLVLSAIGTASASAAECPGTGSGIALCVEKHEQEGAFAFASSPSGNATLHWGGDNGVEIHCTEETTTGTLDASKVANLKLTGLTLKLSNCEIPLNPVTEESCDVPPITFNGEGSLGATFGSTETITLSSGAKKGLWGTVIIKGVNDKFCVYATKGMPVSGQEACSIQKAGLESTGHELFCNRVGSKVKIFEEDEATLEISSPNLALSSGKDWSVQKN